MINCRFIFQFASGGASDSLNRIERVHAIPRIGEKVSITNNDGSSSGAMAVKDVIHWINSETGEHAVDVYYG
jgi:tripartite-type tricarboxylate transporter receptor subunit TctC